MQANISLSWSTSEISGRLVLSKMFKPSSNIFTDASNVVSFVHLFCYLCFFFVCYTVQPCSQQLGWPHGSLVMFSCVSFFTFPYSVLGQVWYLIGSIPDICLLPYFKMWLIWKTNTTHTFSQCPFQHILFFIYRASLYGHLSKSWKIWLHIFMHLQNSIQHYLHVDKNH